MKKFIVIALMIFELVSNVSAGSAPIPYYWDIVGIASSQAVDTSGVSRAFEWENVEGGTYSTSWNHGGTVYAVIGVLGYGTGTPVTTFNNASMQIFQIDPISDQSGTVIGYYYTDSGSSGNVEIKDWSSSSYGTRDSVFVK